MKVTIITGQHKGLRGDMQGDLTERRKTLGKDGKIVFRPDNNPARSFLVRIKHVAEIRQFLMFPGDKPLELK